MRFNINFTIDKFLDLDDTTSLIAYVKNLLTDHIETEFDTNVITMGVTYEES